MTSRSLIRLNTSLALDLRAWPGIAAGLNAPLPLVSSASSLELADRDFEIAVDESPMFTSGVGSITILGATGAVFVFLAKARDTKVSLRRRKLSITDGRRDCEAEPTGGGEAQGVASHSDSVIGVELAEPLIIV